MRQLIVDYIPFSISAQQINESMKENDGKLIVKGVLQRAEAKNQNGRIYPREILTREAKKYTQVQIKERRALGELDHPDSSVVNLNNVSHNVLEMHWGGNDLVGTVEILSTPAGNILKELFKSGIKLGISSRGLGSIKQEAKGDEVQSDFELIAFDFVSNPSTHGAFLSPISEGVSSKKLTKSQKWAKVEYDIQNILTGKLAISLLDPDQTAAPMGIINLSMISFGNSLRIKYSPNVSSSKELLETSFAAFLEYFLTFSKNL